ncbi:alpha/beta fold hydrolase [Paenibacillus phyllosphaerae]|uniref:alpha/beta fold hydrolase n=1 Tax=Paenibacillus phyllosphaerae TaxID=274593 RepID=UPI00161F446B|nr:alpha/beta hydrolase [Paenibacillus phyllosphaerae]
MNDDIIKRNHVNIQGHGTQPILFAHGYGCDQHMWRKVAPAFENRYRVILFDYVGAGRSDLNAYSPTKYASLDGYAQDIIDVCDALQLKNVLFVGHSVSGMIGLLASIARPELFDRIMMIGPSPCYLNDPPYFGGFDSEGIDGLLALMEENFFGWANTLAPVIMGNPDRPELAGELAESFCAMDPAIARNFARATFLADNRKDLPKVTVPSLILQCTEDAIAPVQVGDYMHEQLANSTLVHMRATGHCPHLSHAEETVIRLKKYLSTPLS